MTEPIDKKEKYIEYFADVPIQKYAAMYIGKDQDTIIRWRKEDSDFAERVEAVRAEWVRGKVNKANVDFALERIEKEIFTEKRELEITTPVPIMELPDVTDNNSSKEDTSPPEEN